MKAHNSVEINNELDITVSRILKNWASMNQPPTNGRERLLKVASLPPAQLQLSKSNMFIAFLREHLFYTDLELRYQDDWPDGLMDRNMSWAVCFSTNWRMAI
jgi:hypothetical protein